MKLIQNKYSIKVIKPKPNPMPITVPEPADPEPVPKKRSPALVKAQQKYYQKNKEKITEKQILYNTKYCKLTHICDCGDTVSNSAKYSHRKSARHIRRMENIQKGLPAGTTQGEKYIDCPCGGHFVYKQRHQHYRTQKHHLYEADKQTELKRQLEQNTQETIRNQLRKMLLEEEIEEEDTSNNVNSSEIKEL